jgi:hypothetical protein
MSPIPVPARSYLAGCALAVVGRVQVRPLNAGGAEPRHEPHGADTAPGRRCLDLGAGDAPSNPGALQGSSCDVGTSLMAATLAWPLALAGVLIQSQ